MNIEYPARLVIYDAGDMRSSFVTFWKATAIFQFGLVGVFLAPMQYRNENEPDPNMRLLKAVAGKEFIFFSRNFPNPSRPFRHLSLSCHKTSHLSEASSRLFRAARLIWILFIFQSLSTAQRFLILNVTEVHNLRILVSSLPC